MRALPVEEAGAFPCLPLRPLDLAAVLLRLDLPLLRGGAEAAGGLRGVLRLLEAREPVSLRALDPRAGARGVEAVGLSGRRTPEREAVEGVFAIES